MGLIIGANRKADKVIRRRLTPSSLGRSGDPNRGEWCTPKWLAEAVGHWDLDPFSNARSHILADASCSLERGDDGFGDGSPGSHLRALRGHPRLRIADQDYRVWLQPPYGIVSRAFAHYRHTRWCALLRFDPRTRWWNEIYEACEVIAVIRRSPDDEAFNFEPPPGVEASSNPYPHALYYAQGRDMTPAVEKLCAVWRKKPR